MKRRAFIVLLPLAAFLVAAAVPMLVLQVEAVKKDRILLVRAVQPESTFATRFIHSVELCPVNEYFRIDEQGRIVLFETTFAYSSVGLPYRAFGQEIFAVEKDKFRLSNMHRVIPAINLWVNEKYDNTLSIGQEKIPLFKLAGNTLLKISIERLSLLRYLLVRSRTWLDL
jgi:hypothetical protein